MRRWFKRRHTKVGQPPTDPHTSTLTQATTLDDPHSVPMPWGGEPPPGLAPVLAGRLEPAMLTWRGTTSEWVVWKEADERGHSVSLSSAPSTLNVITYNIWFDESHQRPRFDAMLNLLFNPDKDSTEWPDVIALQEVTSKTAAWLLQDTRVREHYCVTDPAITIFETFYGVVSLIAKRLVPSASAEYYRFGAPLVTDTGAHLPGMSVMGRGVLIVRSHAMGVAVGNVHLESPMPRILPETRRAQLLLCTTLLERAAATLGDPSSGTHTGDMKRWFLMGDFNFVSEAEDAGIRDAGGVDLWSLWRPDDQGMTFDHRANRNIRSPYTTRPDRIIARHDLVPTTPVTRAPANAVDAIPDAAASPPDVTTSTTPAIPPGTIGMVGQDCCPGLSVPPSDHLGLTASVPML
eukprot:m.197986 g.197986  ORF g.197986 m.197986 type:complete len:405 (-) comp20298_c0_seq1:152-1366(-)